MNKRQKRLERKFKCQLICENCKKWTHVSYDMWRRFSKDNKGNPKEYIYWCKRHRCKKSRPEGIVPEREDRGKNKKNSHKSTQHKAQSKGRESGRSQRSDDRKDIQREQVRQ